MKKYEAPELKLAVLLSADVISVSGTPAEPNYAPGNTEQDETEIL